MLTMLDLLVIVFLAMVAAGVLSLSLMFLVRNPRVKKVFFFITAALGLYAAYVGIRIGSGLFPVQTAIGVVVGLVTIGAVVLALIAKGEERKTKLARIMAAAALVVGLINAFA